ncbi:hypothetical protein GS504_01215 [Rhodococcus hoagii]|nr:hypothetical protein [Prescottella equi]NKS71707.1 hypothetical protein [Prescottella equi]
MPYQLLGAVAVLAIAGGIWLVVSGSKDRRDPAAPKKLRGKRRSRLSDRARIMLITGFVVGLGIWFLSGWAIAVVLTPAAFVFLPTLFDKPAGEGEIVRLNAMDDWVRNLTNVLAVGQGIEQAILATERSIPEPINQELGDFIARLKANAPTKTAIRIFARDLNDATGDLICTNLLLAAELRGAGLATALNDLAETVTRDVRNRREVEAGRKSQRTVAKVVTIVTLAMLIGMFALTRYFDPYKTPSGQIVLTFLLCAYGGCLYYLKVLTKPRKLPRLLDTGDDLTRPYGKSAPKREKVTA